MLLHAHPGRAELVGGQLHHVVDGRLADPIGAEPPVGVAGRDRRDAHERTAASPDQLARDVLEHVHGAVDVQVDGASPAFRVDLGDRPDRFRATRAMHRPVELTVPCRRGVHRTGGLVLVGDVGGLVANGAATLERLDLVDGPRQPVGVAADDHDRGAGCDQPGGHALADSAATAGDQICPVFERKLHATPSQTETGSRYRTMRKTCRRQRVLVTPAAGHPRATAYRGGPPASASRYASPRRRAAGRPRTCSRCGPPSAHAPTRECGTRAATPR